MSVVQFAILIIVIVALAAVCAWFVRSSGLTIPQPLLIVLYAVVAIFAILLLASVAGVGPVGVRW